MNYKIVGLVVGAILVIFVVAIGLVYSHEGFSNNISKFVCDLRGGQMRPINCNMDSGTCDSYCLVESKDTNKPCTSSSQCSSGYCIVKSPDVPLPVEHRPAPTMATCKHSQDDSYECPNTVVFQAVCGDATVSQNCFGFWNMVGNNQIKLATGTCPNAL
jgi:hypothetical protein